MYIRTSFAFVCHLNFPEFHLHQQVSELLVFLLGFCRVAEDNDSDDDKAEQKHSPDNRSSNDVDLLEIRAVWFYVIQSSNIVAQVSPNENLNKNWMNNTEYNS